jgi:hypothetical protein
MRLPEVQVNGRVLEGSESGALREVTGGCRRLGLDEGGRVDIRVGGDARAVTGDVGGRVLRNVDGWGRREAGAWGRRTYGDV